MFSTITPKKNHKKKPEKTTTLTYSENSLCYSPHGDNNSSMLSFGLTDSLVSPARFSISKVEDSNMYTDLPSSPKGSPISKTSSSNSLTNSPTTPIEIPNSLTNYPATPLETLKSLEDAFSANYLPTTPIRTPLCSPRSKTELMSASSSSTATSDYGTIETAQAFAQAEKYFQENPGKVKFKRGHFGLPSFLKIDQKIFMIPKGTRLGTGANAYAKLVTDKEGIKYVLKIIPAKEVGDSPYNRWLNEKNILEELNIEVIFMERNNQDSWLSKEIGHPDHAPNKFTKKLILLTKYEDNVKTVKQYFQELKKDLTALARLELLSKILKELQKIHNKGIIHNDITLDNVLFKLDNQGKIDKVIFIDFEFSLKLEPGQLVAPTKDHQCINCTSAPETFSFTKYHLNTNSYEKEHPLVVHIKEVEKILNDKDAKGFVSPFSDLYNLAKNLMRGSFQQPFYRENQIDNDPDEKFLKEIIEQMICENPFQRSSTEKLIKKCEGKIEELKSKQSLVDNEDDVIVGNGYLQQPKTPAKTSARIRRGSMHLYQPLRPQRLDLNRIVDMDGSLFD